MNTTGLAKMTKVGGVVSVAIALTTLWAPVPAHAMCQGTGAVYENCLTLENQIRDLEFRRRRDEQRRRQEESQRLQDQEAQMNHDAFCRQLRQARQWNVSCPENNR